MKNLLELQEIKARKEQDISLLKRVGSILVNIRDITEILLGLSENQSLVITKNGEIFKGKVSTDKLTPLARRIPGKTEGSFDINSYVSFDNSMLENQEVSRKKSVNTVVGWKTVTKLYKKPKNLIGELFMNIWELQEENNPKNVEISKQNSPMGHEYLLIRIKNKNMVGKISTKTGNLLYVEIDGKEYSV